MTPPGPEAHTTPTPINLINTKGIPHDLLRIEPPAGKERWEGEIRFDTPRHREIFHLEQNFLRLNELPEWFTVEREANYLLKHAGGKRIEAKGEALAKGMRMTEGDWVVEKAGMVPARQ